MTGYNLKQHFRVLMFTVFIMTCVSSISFAATYYVATNGNDGNPGTSSSPFRTVQKGLNTVQPGDTCIIRGGTYNEALVLGQSGTSSAPITVKNYTGETVTVSSGSSRALRAGGKKHYYTIDGLRFISTHASFDAYGSDYTIDLQDGGWGGNTDSNAGNNGFIIRNCYIEGAIYIYGHYNLVENCELNGKSLWKNGIWERQAASHHNTYRKNKIYSYAARGVWSMQYTDAVLIEGNTVHDIGDQGIDCDGAWHPVYNSVVRGNTVYNTTNQGIQMENAFNSIVEKNIVYNSRKWGITYINYGYGPDYTADAEYRTTNTNGIIRNNLLYTSVQAGIICLASPGNKIYNNTVYKTVNTGAFWGGIVLAKYGNYYSPNTDIRNNIIAENSPFAVWIEGPSSGLSNVTLNNNLYYSSSKTATHYMQNIGTYTLAQYQSARGQDSSSVFAGPGFINPSANDFHLAGTSPAVDAGATVSGVTDDLDGISRPQGRGCDIGAYELSAGQTSVSAPQNLRVLN